MADQIAVMPVTFSDLDANSSIASPFKLNFFRTVGQQVT